MALAGSKKAAYLVCKAFTKFAENTMGKESRKKLDAEATATAKTTAAHIWSGLPIKIGDELKQLSFNTNDHLLATGRIFMGYLELAYPTRELMYLTTKTIERALERVEKICIKKNDSAIVRKLAGNVWPGEQILGMRISPENADYYIQLGIVPENGVGVATSENVMFR